MPVATHDRVRLELPVDSHYIRVARVVAGDVGAASGLEGDAADDLGVAVDELCTALVEVGDESLDLLLVRRDHDVEVHGRTIRAPSAVFDSHRLALSRRILGAACDRYSLELEEGLAHFTLHKRA